MAGGGSGAAVPDESSPAAASGQSLAQVARVFTNIVANGPRTSPADVEAAFRHKLLPMLRPAFHACEADRVAFIKLLCLLRARGTLSRDQLTTLFATIFPLLAQVPHTAPASYANATRLLLEICEGICTKGRAGRVLTSGIDALSALQEQWCRREADMQGSAGVGAGGAGGGAPPAHTSAEDAFAIRFMPGLVDGASPSSAPAADAVHPAAPALLVVTSRPQLLKLTMLLVRCCVIAAQFVPAGPSHAALARACVFLVRHAGGDADGETVVAQTVDALRQVVPRLPQDAGVDATASVVGLAIELCCGGACAQGDAVEDRECGTPAACPPATAASAARLLLAAVRHDRHAVAAAVATTHRLRLLRRAVLRGPAGDDHALWPDHAKWDELLGSGGNTPAPAAPAATPPPPSRRGGGAATPQTPAPQGAAGDTPMPPASASGRKRGRSAYDGDGAASPVEGQDAADDGREAANGEDGHDGTSAGVDVRRTALLAVLRVLSSAPTQACVTAVFLPMWRAGGGTGVDPALQNMAITAVRGYVKETLHRVALQRQRLDRGRALSKKLKALGVRAAVRAEQQQQQRRLLAPDAAGCGENSPALRPEGVFIPAAVVPGGSSSGAATAAPALYLSTPAVDGSGGGDAGGVGASGLCAEEVASDAVLAAVYAATTATATGAGASTSVIGDLASAARTLLPLHPQRMVHADAATALAVAYLDALLPMLTAPEALARWVRCCEDNHPAGAADVCNAIAALLTVVHCGAVPEAVRDQAADAVVVCAREALLQGRSAGGRQGKRRQSDGNSNVPEAPPVVIAAAARSLAALPMHVRCDARVDILTTAPTAQGLPYIPALARAVPLSETFVAKLGEYVLQAYATPQHPYPLSLFPTLLAALYTQRCVSAEAGEEDASSLKTKKGGGRKAAAKGKGGTVSATFEFAAWRGVLDASAGALAADTMRVVAAMVAAHAQEAAVPAALARAVRGHLVGGNGSGLGCLASQDPQERDAAKTLVLALIDKEATPGGAGLLDAVFGNGGGGGGGFHALITHISPRINDGQTPAEVVFGLTLILGAICRAIRIDDPALCALVGELVLQLKQGEDERSLSLVLLRQELQKLEARLNVSLGALFTRFPALFEPLMRELPEYNATRSVAVAPLLNVVSDYMDMDVDTYIAANMAVLIAYIIRTPEHGPPAARITALTTCVKELGAARLAKYKIALSSNDGTIMIGELLLVYILEILQAVLLQTEGATWEAYFHAVVKQLAVINDYGRGMYASALKHTGANLVKNIVESIGKVPDFETGVSRARRAIEMYYLMQHTTRDAGDGRADESPIPAAPDALSEAARLGGARERTAASVFSVLDSVGELLVGEGRNLDSMTVGLTTVRGIIVLLGPMVAKCTAKITPTLTFNYLFGMGSAATGAQRRPQQQPKSAGAATAHIDPKLGALLADTWRTYIKELPPDVIERNLDAFVVEAVCMARISDDCAAALLQELYAKTPKRDAWMNVRQFIPTTPAFQRTLTTIGGPKATSLTSGIAALLAGLASLSRECRRVSLQALESLLKTHRHDILTMTRSTRSTDDVLDPIVRRVVHALLKITRDWDADLDMLGHAMACLGLIGAIDPTKFVGADTDAIAAAPPPASNSRRGSVGSASASAGTAGDAAVFSLEDFDDDTFAVRLINDFLFKTLHLPGWQAGRSSAHDKAAYAIQELFKLLTQRSRARSRQYEHESVRDEVRSYPWWNMVLPEAKEVLAPYLETRYVTVITQPRDAKAVEFAPGMLFRSWLKAWMVNLIGKTAGPRGSIFQSVRNVVKDDVDMALFILPYLVLNVIVHGGDQAVNVVAREVLAVLAHADARPGAASEHVQVICTLLGKLNRWKCSVHERRQLRRLEEQSRSRQSRITVSVEDEGRAKHVAELMDKVPFVMLARACRVTNPARALYYTEYHFRAVRDKSAVRSQSRALTQLSQVGLRRWCDPKDLRLYQDVYARLREPDGLLGIQSLRTQHEFEEGLEEQALDLETVGHWSDAAQRYELLVEQNPDSLYPQERMMECLQSLGQYSTTIAYASNRPALQRYAAQAAWRLGEWPIVEQALGVGGAAGGATATSAHIHQQASAAVTATATATHLHDAAIAVGGNGISNGGNAVHEFETGVALSLLSMHRGEYAAVGGIVRATRLGLHSDLSAASLEGYGTAYQSVVKLHALCDIERAAELAANVQSGGRRLVGTEIANEFVGDLARHTALTEATPNTRGILLAVRRAISGVFGSHKHASRTWLEYGKLCRNAGLYQVADGALLRAERCPKDVSHRPEGLILQMAKLQKAQGQVHMALQTVNNPDPNLEEYEEDAMATKAKMRLLAVNWACDINHLAAKDVVQEYKDIATQKPSEAVYLSLAKFQDKLLAGLKEQIATQQRAFGASLDMEKATFETKKTELQLSAMEKLVANVNSTLPGIMRAYTVSLTYGTKHLYLALPRLITSYIDEATSLSQIAHEAQIHEKAAKKHVLAMDDPQARMKALSKKTQQLIRACEEGIATLNAEMTFALDNLSGAVLYTSLTTLVPLLSHPTTSVVKVLAQFVRKVIKLFPERAVWSLIQFLYSEKRERQQVLAREVIKPMEADPAYVTALDLYHQAKIATRAINRLAEEKPKERKVNFHRYDYYKPLGDILPLGLVVPIQEQLTLTLPHHPVSDKEAALLFPQNEKIKAVLSEAAVMASMQSPKRVTFLTSTGVKRSFLCKARDELRKDSKIMELCHIMNLLLRKNPETRRRQLYCRTFAVTLTADQSGMIEWVEDVKPFRSILDDLYARAGLGMRTSDIRALMEKREAGHLQPLQMYKDICARYPPLYHKWLAESFPDPTAWFSARNAHTKTCAVWSMIGHIVGLGDRHAENILIDTSTGDMVHVDFAVLFDKGMSLAVPEVIRFRLTPNMVDAFGICGVEGVFRGCAELTMSLMRSNKDMVMSIMDQFVNDPCMDRSDGSELPNIERRLAGFYDDPPELVRRRVKSATGGVQLGVKGQVQKLIANTTSQENFSKIYIWWMAWY